MKEDWEEQLRRKLEGHEVEPPEGLWESISAKLREMGYNVEPVSQEPVGKKSVSRRWWWAAAAAVVALGGFFAFHNGIDSELPQQASVVSQQPVTQQPPSQQLPSQQPEETRPVENKPPAENKPSSTAHLLASELPDTLTEPQQTLDEPLPKEERHHQPQTEKTYQHHNDNYPSSTTIRQPLKRWSVGVNASGGLLAANTSQRTERPNYQTGTAYTFIAEIDNYLYYNTDSELTEYVSEHHLPIRFGLSVNYRLSPRLALHSGIGYTYLYSKFSVPLHNNISYDQKLHYVGIPLGVTWQLWSASHFRFYVSGGAMVEKCVSAQFEDGSTVDKKPWQWSVEAAAGAEYTFTRQLGVYLEPSLGYYFDDGTFLEHYYKEHPLAPSIEFGFRLHLDSCRQ